MIDKDIYFEEIWELVSSVIDKLRHSGDECSVGIIAKFPEAKEVVKELIMCDADINGVELQHPEIDGYEDEYYIGVDIFEGEISISCYPLKDNDEYYDVCDDIIYIFGDCNSRVYKHCESKEVHPTYMGDETDCDGDIYGFTVGNETDNGYSKFTYYSSSPVDKTEIKNILREFGF